MRLLASLGIGLVATSAVSDTVPAVHLQACLEQPIEQIDMAEDFTEDQRKSIGESIRSEFDKACIQSATQSCFQSDNSDRCFGALNLYVEEEYVRIFETKAPQSIDLSNDETAHAVIGVLQDYRTNEMASGSGYSCNYSKSMCDFIFNSMLLVDLRSVARNSKQSN